jgi:hypothetical protein
MLGREYNVAMMSGIVVEDEAVEGLRLDQWNVQRRELRPDGSHRKAHMW